MFEFFNAVVLCTLFNFTVSFVIPSPGITIYRYYRKLVLPSDAKF